jgi:hypothetical protein
MVEFMMPPLINPISKIVDRHQLLKDTDKNAKIKP